MTQTLPARADGGPAPDRRSRPEFHGSAVAAFRESAAAHPGRAAVVGVDATLTYAELDDRSDRLATLLAARGAGPERAVGVLLPRTADLIVAILGILKTGAVYVPFDPEQPAQRLGRIVRDAAPVTTITHADLVDSLPEGSGPDPVLLDRTDWSTVERSEPAVLHPDNLAYIIFTSGSTGRPKGVEVSHRALISFLNGMEQGGFFGPPGVRLAWNASVAFDASVQEWVRVFRGDTVGVLTDDMRRDAEEFAEFMVERELTEADMTPSHAQMLIEDLVDIAGPERHLRLFIAGEAVPPGLWSRLQALIGDGVVTAMNLYGPTEAAVNVAGTFIRPGESPTIGRPLAGVEARVVDTELVPVPDGTPGELCVAGSYLARGYSGRAGLTAARFVPDPLSADGARMYRTGDRVVRRADGTIEYIGRTDDQIKIRGHRVELGEIESVLADHPDVSRAVMLYQRGDDGGRLSAVLHLRPGGDLKAVRAYAAGQLPTWMQPSDWAVVDAIPLTVGGKADRSALIRRLTSAEDAPDGSEPAKETQMKVDATNTVREVWCEVLELEKVDDEDDFFVIGGHSLSAMQVASRLRAGLGGVKIPTRMLFEHRTFTAFTAAVNERLNSAAVSA
ncbi:non-ribosomal peptide synthetase [Micromonospora sp. NBC_01638]|uniref:non-ribosomal peptide synthetase n=1 Tax=Micromonospora sp. NBC_01638 TaxID=2975982 RepID=UPI00386EDF0D|nr:non-ribosomal peptide synthetase [Micromonospora sp. NBC_01638]